MLNKLFPNAPNVLGLEVMKKSFIPPAFSLSAFEFSPSAFIFRQKRLVESIRSRITSVFHKFFFFFFFWRCLSWMSTTVCSSASWHGKDKCVPEMSEGPAGCPPRALTHSSLAPLTPSAHLVNWQQRSNNCALISGSRYLIQQLKSTGWFHGAMCYLSLAGWVSVRWAPNQLFQKQL